MKKIFLSKIAVIIYLISIIGILYEILYNVSTQNKSTQNTASVKVTVELNKVSDNNLKPAITKQLTALQGQENAIKNDDAKVKAKEKVKDNRYSKKLKFHHQKSKSTNSNKKDLPKQNLPMKISPRIEQSISSNSKLNATETKFLFPLYQSNDANGLIYVDLRAGIDNSTSHKTDIALGYRKLFSNTNFLNQNQWILGTYAAIGRSYSRYKNEFQQKSFGIEALSLVYDFRANFYIAENKEKHIDNDSFDKAQDLDHDIYWNTTNLNRQKALNGADFELGYKLPILVVDAKIYAGGYYYQRPKNSQITLGQYDSILSNNDYNSINGQKLRLELNFNHNNLKSFNKNTNLTLASEYKHDRLNQGQLFMIAKLSYQFGSSTQISNNKVNKNNNRANNNDNHSLNDLHYRMNEFVIRSEIVNDDRNEVVKRKGNNIGGGEVPDSGDGGEI